jgi:hypothetical protein
VRRWRTVGLVGVPTTDGRTIVGTVTFRAPALPVRRQQRDPRGGTVMVSTANVRMRGGQIQAFLRWRERHANLDLQSPAVDWDAATENDDGTWALILRDPQVIGLTVAGPSAWKELR